MHPAAEHYCSGLEEIDYAVEAAETAPFRHGPSFEVNGVHYRRCVERCESGAQGENGGVPACWTPTRGQCKYSPAAEAKIQCHKEILVSDTAETRDGHCVVRQTSTVNNLAAVSTNSYSCDITSVVYLCKTYRLTHNARRSR